MSLPLSPPEPADSPTRRDPLGEAIGAIRQRTNQPIGAGIILGSGLGGLAQRIEAAVSIPFEAIPHFAWATAAGHRGSLIVGRLAGMPVVAMAGRLHRYEGWSTAQVTFPVRVMAAMGAQTLIVTNAAGGLCPHHRVGDLVIVRDHIDFLRGAVSMRGERIARDGGPAASAVLPGMARRGSSPYDSALAARAAATARRENFAAYPGTYFATLGPNYETRAEYRMMRRLGADVVGMSTVPEVLEAARQGLRVLALSWISNVARPDQAVPADHAQVLQAGTSVEPKLAAIVLDALQG